MFGQEIGILECALGEKDGVVVAVVGRSGLDVLGTQPAQIPAAVFHIDEIAFPGLEPLHHHRRERDLELGDRIINLIWFIELI